MDTRATARLAGVSLLLALLLPACEEKTSKLPTRQTAAHLCAVCGAPAPKADMSSQYQGKPYYFDKPTCKISFDQSPQQYAKIADQRDAARPAPPAQGH